MPTLNISNDYSHLSTPHNARPHDHPSGKFPGFPKKHDLGWKKTWNPARFMILYEATGPTNGVPRKIRSYSLFAILFGLVYMLVWFLPLHENPLKKKQVGMPSIYRSNFRVRPMDFSSWDCIFVPIQQLLYLGSKTWWPARRRPNTESSEPYDGETRGLCWKIRLAALTDAPPQILSRRYWSESFWCKRFQPRQVFPKAWEYWFGRSRNSHGKHVVIFYT